MRISRFSLRQAPGGRRTSHAASAETTGSSRFEMPATGKNLGPWRARRCCFRWRITVTKRIEWIALLIVILIGPALAALAFHSLRRSSAGQRRAAVPAP